MRLDALDYDLPPELIATQPASPRDAARLMVARRETGRLDDRHVRELDQLDVLMPGDLVLLNETRVIPARFHATRVGTGGRVAGLYLATVPSRGRDLWQVMLEAGGKLQPGETLQLDELTTLELVEPLGAGQWHVHCTATEPAHAVLQRLGETPLPPYIDKARRQRGHEAVAPADAELYNTIYAREPGSVAAPTAGLHLTAAMLDRLASRGVHVARLTLHVGLGTFAPIRVEQLARHEMHEETVHVPAATIDAIRRTREQGRRILAVGTTTVRAVESLPEPLDTHTGDFATRTRLFIHPDAAFHFRFTDMLMTNFHLPRSTLLAMVAALPGVGIDRLMQWYRHAIDQRYRFYSFGDAMLIV